MHWFGAVCCVLGEELGTWNAASDAVVLSIERLDHEPGVTSQGRQGSSRHTTHCNDGNCITYTSPVAKKTK
jgi:hypothetical protein